VKYAPGHFGKPLSLHLQPATTLYPATTSSCTRYQTYLSPQQTLSHLAFGFWLLALHAIASGHCDSTIGQSKFHLRFKPSLQRVSSAENSFSAMI
jgi:hypothetical protein